MISALRVFWRGLMQFERYGALYVLTNIAAILLSLPIITAPAAFAGLVAMSHKAQSGHTTTFSEFWDGFRASLGRGVAIGVANLIVIGILVANFFTYSAQSGGLFVLLRVIWLIILIGWIGLQIYLWPMMAELEYPTLGGAFRNAALMFSLNPIFTLTLLALLLIVALISTALLVPWVLITPGFIAAVATAAVRDRLALARGTRVDQPDREDLRAP